MFLKVCFADYKKFSIHNGVILRAFFILMLLHPLFMLTIRSWSSGIYSFLAILAIIYLAKNREFHIQKEIKIYTWILFLFFISILISSTLNGWTQNSYNRLGMELKILIAIPFMLVVSQHHEIRKWFVYSIPLAGIILGMHALIEILIFNEPFANSSYGKIITGDTAGLLAGLSGVILIYSKDSWLKKICIFAMVLAAIACILSTSRNGWLVLFFNTLFLLLLSFKRSKKLTTLLVIAPIIAAVIASTMLDINKGFDTAINQFIAYSNKIERDKANLIHSSVGVRLEQWRVTLIAFPDKPIFGAGPGNSALIINDYIKKGIADPDLYHPGASTDMGHVHNQFLDTLLVQGVVGFILLVLMLFYPAWIFVKYYSRNKIYANLGIVLIISYTISSLTEMPFVSDNYTSIFFIFMAVFLPNVVNTENELNIEV